MRRNRALRISNRMKLTVLPAVAALAVLAALGGSATAGDMPDSWYYPSAKNAKVRSLEGKPAPEINVTDWIGKSQKLSDLKGKIVVIDFWATWCRPCMMAIPHNNEIAERYKDDVVFIGIHASGRGADKVPQTADQQKINYPLAVDNDGKSAGDYNVSFWPTYVVIDRKGTVRAAGLSPVGIERAIRFVQQEQPSEASQRLANKPAAGATADIPQAWLEGAPRSRERLSELEKRDKAPSISDASLWINTDPLTLKKLEGKVILLDFWATWCAPCKRAVPHTNQLQAKYEKDGLVIIGVCHPRGADTMPTVADQLNIEFPICADAEGEIIKEYKVDSFPDYYLIDRAGKLRIMDCRNDKIEDAIKLLLAEDPPSDAEPTS